MNILVISNISPFQIGGAEVQVRRLVEAWLKEGHRVIVLGNRVSSCEVMASESKHAFQCVHLPTILTNRLTRAVTYGLSLTWYILKYRKKIDIIYCRFLQEAALVISLLKMLNVVSLPLITCPACSGKQGDAYFVEQLPATQLLVNILNKGCDKINIISPEIGNELIRINIDQKNFVQIPNGVSLPVRPIPIEKKIATQHKSCVFVGRLTGQKGLPYLFRAISALAKKSRYTDLTVIGDGPDRKKLKKLAKELGIEKQIKFSGQIVHEKINSLLCNYSIFVLPSLYEGAPNALLEAMAIGLPALVTRCGGSEYFIDNSVGRVAKAGDVDSLAQALHELLELTDEELHDMGLAARERVKNNFDINVVADKYIQLFNQYV